MHLRPHVPVSARRRGLRFVFWAMQLQLLLVSVQRGNAEMYRRSGLVMSLEQLQGCATMLVSQCQC